jgi:phosphohistidine phosphatase SixA
MSAGDTGSGILAGGGYNLLISLGFELGRILVSHLTRAKAPAEIIDAAQAAVNAIENHAKDIMSAADWESLRAPIPTEGQVPTPDTTP